MITRSVVFIGAIIIGIILLRKIFFADLWKQGHEVLHHRLNKLGKA